MLKIYPVFTLLLLVAFLLGCAAKQEDTAPPETEPSMMAETPETSPEATEATATPDATETVPEAQESTSLEPTLPQTAEAPKKLVTRSLATRSLVTTQPKSITQAESDVAPVPETVSETTGSESITPLLIPAQSEPLADTAEPSPSEAAEGYEVVRVFYGTDRKVTTGVTSHPLGRIPWSLLAMATGVVTLLSIPVGVIWIHGRKAVTTFLLLLLATAGFGSAAVLIPSSTKPDIARTDVAYSNERGEFELGTCEVSIPECHELAELESPSIFHLEITEDPTKHVVLLGIDRLEEGPFLEELRQSIQSNDAQEAFVFIHGYNVTFENAARRTAQLAYDLKFKGAPIFYSWPSQGGLLQYTVDETNVEWTVPHLKQFLKLIAEQSGAKRVHLIAHSMGNRALTNALKEISYTDTQNGPLFNEVVLTAPDIDAEIFRRDLAPQIIKTAQRVTLYASSNDEALIASKKVHGYPRAGESGETVVVVPGIDTIDVSGLDTSLLGHSYYGSNDTVLIDMAQLLLESKPPTLRSRLEAKTFEGLSYWRFLIENLHAEIKDRIESSR